MGKLIKCASRIAEHPYCFKATRTNVYSIEEVCYYLKHNIYMMQEEVFDASFAVWLRQELGMEETARKVDALRQDTDNLKDMVVTLCCSCDYYTEEEINELIRILDQTRDLSRLQRQKIKAQSYYDSGSLEQAKKEYEQILSGEEMLRETPEETGRLYHLLGVIYARLGELHSAAQAFRQGYELNRRPACLQSYLYALRLAGEETAYQKALQDMGVTQEQAHFFRAQYEQAEEQAREGKEYRQILRFEQMLQDPEQKRESEIRIREMLDQWKAQYRSYME